MKLIKLRCFSNLAVETLSKNYLSCSRQRKRCKYKLLFSRDKCL